MVYHTDIEKFNAENPVVTVGIFDGVHRGHRFILERLRDAAAGLNGESVLLTLWPHPRTILNQVDDSFRLLNTLEEKKVLLAEAGIDHMAVIPFTNSFSRLSSCEFIRDYLVERIGIRHLVVGYNHRFGRDREGDFDKLSKCASEYGFGIEMVPELESGPGELSSSVIRNLIQSGDVSGASRLLGYEYSLKGEVIGGSRLGTSIGFPTANITPSDSIKLLPKSGVYAVRALLKGENFPGMLNIGTRPTVNDNADNQTIEVHMLDFSQDVYNEEIRIHFIERLRDEKKFPDIDSLRKQLQVDKENTRRVFRDL